MYQILIKAFDEMKNSDQPKVWKIITELSLE